VVKGGHLVGDILFLPGVSQPKGIKQERISGLTK